MVAPPNFDATWYALVDPFALLTLTTIEVQRITPTVLWRWLKMNPVVVFFAIRFRGRMWALLGVLFSVPTMTLRLGSPNPD